MAQPNIKQKILQQKQELLTKINALEQDLHRVNKPLDKDFSEQAIEMENDDVVNALYNDAKQELVQINIALQRLENGQYEYCSSCEEKIAPERLKVLPYTTLCIKCAEQRE